MAGPKLQVIATTDNRRLRPMQISRNTNIQWDIFRLTIISGTPDTTNSENRKQKCAAVTILAGCGPARPRTATLRREPYVGISKLSVFGTLCFRKI